MEAGLAVALLAARAADQWGLVTSAQAAADGVDTTTMTRLCSVGTMSRLAHGVYQVLGATDVRHLEEKVAWLRLAPTLPALERRPLDMDGGVLSHRSAALLHNIGDLSASEVEIIVPVRRQTRDPSVKLRRGRLSPEDVTTVEGLLPVTTIERTIADLAAEHIDGGHLGDLIADARKRGTLDEKDLAQRIAPHGPAYGMSVNGHELIDQLLRQAGDGTQPTDPTGAMAQLGVQLANYFTEQQRIVQAVQSMDSMRSMQSELARVIKAHPQFAEIFSKVAKAFTVDPAIVEQLANLADLGSRLSVDGSPSVSPHRRVRSEAEK